jgi:hypothetical protein
MLGNPFASAERALAPRQHEIQAELLERLHGESYMQALNEVYTQLFKGMEVDAGELIEYVEHHMAELQEAVGPPREWHISAVELEPMFGPNAGDKIILRSFALSIASAVLMFAHLREQTALGYLTAEIPELRHVEVPRLLEAWNEGLRRA